MIWTAGILPVKAVPNHSNTTNLMFDNHPATPTEAAQKN